jgi:hypothetical protein
MDGGRDVRDSPTSEIPRFLGIVVRMHYREHARPHFHARYGEHSVVVEIESGAVEG